MAAHYGPSPRTRALRYPTGLAPETEDYIRKLRREHGMTVSEIATRLGIPEERVRLATMTLRTRNPAATRRSINAPLAVANDFETEQLPGERAGETLARLLVELRRYRASRSK